MASVAGASVSMRARPREMAMAVKPVLGVSHGRSNLSFKLRPVSSRMRVSCAAKPETVDKVCIVVKNQLGLKDDQPVTAETKFTDLGADSLDTVEIVMGLEEEFKIQMAEEKAQKITTVEQAAELIDELVREKDGQ